MKIIILTMVMCSTCNNVFANTDSQFGSQQVVSTKADQANTVLTADIDDDGDQDVISASFGDNTIAWYSNLDGKGFFGTQRKITDSALGVVDISVADIDGDGDQDVIAATQNRIAWYENLYREGGGNFANFGPAQTISTALQFAESVYAADIDGDGDMDVLSSSTGNQSHKVSWYENTDGLGDFGSQRNLLPANNLNGAYSVHAGDMDGDTDLDIVYGTTAAVYWFKNTDGNGSFGTRIAITTDPIAVNTIDVADLDNDGDLDVLSASSFVSVSSSKITWYKNDGNGNFVEQLALATVDASGAWSVYASDIDNDGDLDVLSASLWDNKIAWYENTDGQGVFGAQKIISEDALDAMSVYAADIDGDGDNDVLSASEGDDKIAWYKNNNVVIDLIFANTFE